MKKFFLCIGCFLLFISGSLHAQQEEQFLDNWFLQGQAGIGYTVGEGSFGKLLSPTAALSIGKYFNPVISTRLQVSGWQGKGAWSTADHPKTSYDFNYGQASLDALFSLTNIFSRYRSDRCFNLIGIIGIGYSHTGNYDEDAGLSSTKSVNSAVARAGVQGNFRLSNAWDFNLELIGNSTNDSFNRKTGSENDWYFNLLAGFTYKFGRKDPVPVINNDALISSLNDQINSQRETIQGLQNELKDNASKVVVEERVRTVIEKKANSFVIFRIGKSSIDKEQKIQIYQIAQFMKENPKAKIEVTGYADAKTGTKSINARLSQERTDAVVKTLLNEYNISSDRIVSNSKGDNTQPFEENDWNRVVIMVSE